jgi:Uma2 family endonuclease
MNKQPPPSEQRVVLTKINWQQYEQLLAEADTERTARFTYDRGRLEMMHPLEEHERYHKLIESMILVLADELKLQVTGYKTPILKRSDLQIGVEPDTGYYIQHATQVSGANQLDLDTDPPPDLIVEVELSKSHLNKSALYAKLGIPEIWRYVSKPGETFLKGKLCIYQLESDRYMETDRSLAFPLVSMAQILQFIDQSDALGLMSALRSLRQWLQATLT